ncbi:hypothetical protein NUH30_16050 [Leptospira sp. 85282-16]|uniref:hypothetical protein n=1 Tax=Leptospira sp. 85282-16 TaxID=2971256 RepID=UPI0021BE2AFC|nr:hypothetical protein [Leptospira sp. 85282-16]MCT8335194.1 hypothetical protein [Leptospira sp. 85282-16]
MHNQRFEEILNRSGKFHEATPLSEREFDEFMDLLKLRYPPGHWEKLAKNITRRKELEKEDSDINWTVATLCNPIIGIFFVFKVRKGNRKLAIFLAMMNLLITVYLPFCYPR